MCLCRRAFENACFWRAVKVVEPDMFFWGGRSTFEKHISSSLAYEKELESCARRGWYASEGRLVCKRRALVSLRTFVGMSLAQALLQGVSMCCQYLIVASASLIAH